jgi:hypothetical protein
MGTWMNVKASSLSIDLQPVKVSSEFARDSLEAYHT